MALTHSRCGATCAEGRRCRSAAERMDGAFGARTRSQAADDRLARRKISRIFNWINRRQSICSREAAGPATLVTKFLLQKGCKETSRERCCVRAPAVPVDEMILGIGNLGTSARSANWLTRGMITPSFGYVRVTRQPRSCLSI